MSCIACKKDINDYTFTVMKVANRRIHINSLNPRVKTMKIQDLLGMETLCVCDECIRKKLKDIDNPVPAFFKHNIPLFGIAVVGLTVGIALFPTDKFAAIIAFVCFLASVHRAITSVSEAKKKKEAFSKCSEENRRMLAAWQIVIDNAPRMEGDARVSFIPVTDATYKMSVEELKKYYVLTMENAQEFYRQIHRKEIEK